MSGSKAHCKILPSPRRWKTPTNLGQQKGPMLNKMPWWRFSTVFLEPEIRRSRGPKGSFLKIGATWNGWFLRENPMKIDDLGLIPNLGNLQMIIPGPTSNPFTNEKGRWSLIASVMENPRPYTSYTILAGKSDYYPEWVWCTTLGLRHYHGVYVFNGDQNLPATAR